LALTITESVVRAIMGFFYMKGDGSLWRSEYLAKEEVSLLDEEQRKQYEKELRIYRQRAAFVEQIEAYEKVRIPPYEPDLKPITVMKKFEVKPYTRPEYTVAEYKPVESRNCQLSRLNRQKRETLCCLRFQSR